MQLSKIIKHLQAQLDQQEEEGAQLKEDLAAACEQIEVLQRDTADHPEALDQVRWATNKMAVLVSQSDSSSPHGFMPCTV